MKALILPEASRIGWQNILLSLLEKKGNIKKGSTIIEPTSGNTGIALAMISKVKGYNMIAVMPDNVSDERKSLLSSLGAEIIFSNGEEGTNGAIRLAQEIDKNNDDYFMPYQYGNEANPRAHYETTGPEIINKCLKLMYLLLVLVQVEP